MMITLPFKPIFRHLTDSVAAVTSLAIILLARPLPTLAGQFTPEDFSANGFGVVTNSAANSTGLTEMAAKIINTLLLLAGIAALISIIYYGIMIATSRGEEAKVEKAKRAIIWTVIGIVVITLSLYLIGSTKNAATPENGGTVETI